MSCKGLWVICFGMALCATAWVNAEAQTEGHDLLNQTFDVSNEAHEVIVSPQVSGLKTLEDEALSDVQGQALVDFSQQVNSDGIQFMKLLLNAKLETNLNIGELKLGDDIHLRKATLSGGEGPDSYATLIRPFVEIAMKNYDDEQNREIIGLRVAFEGSDGVLGVGEQDTSDLCLQNGGDFCSDFGIEKLSGYFEIADGAEATVDLGAIKLAEYLYRRGTGEVFDNGSPDSSTHYVPGNANAGGANYTAVYKDFITTSEPNSFDDHMFNNNLWTGSCSGTVGSDPVTGEATCNGGTWTVRQADGNSGGPAEHISGGQIDSTADATGFCNLFILLCDRFNTEIPREYGVRPGQTDRDNPEFFAIPASQSQVDISAQAYNGKASDLNNKLYLTATGDYATINYVDKRSDNNVLKDAEDDINNGSPEASSYINRVYYDLEGNGEELVGYYDTSNGEIYVDGTAALTYVDLVGGLGSLIVQKVHIIGSVFGIGIDTQIEQDIRFAHRLDISNTNGGNGFFLSLQSENIKYPNTLPDNVAQAGYWLGLETPVELGDLGVLPQEVFLSDIEYRQIEVGVERGLLQQTYLNLSDLGEVVIGGRAAIGDVNVNRPININLSDLPLGATQAPPVNCYGGVDCF